jgi:hypothetical protein
MIPNLERVRDTYREKKIELIADKGYQGIKRFMKTAESQSKPREIL